MGRGRWAGKGGGGEENSLPGLQAVEGDTTPSFFVWNGEEGEGFPDKDWTR